jgi:serine protease AprX
MNPDRSARQGQSPDEHVARGLGWRVSVLAVVTVAMALGTGPALTSASAVTSAGFSQGGEPVDDGKKDKDDAIWGDDDTHESEDATLAGRYLPQLDLSSMYSLTRRIGAREAWSRGITGKDVTVAIIDTGVAKVEGLDTKNKVVNGPDLSYESQRSGTRYLDGFGHGTHMAGIVAGRDGDLGTGLLANPSSFGGVAPNARILNMKVASGDGGADVTAVIAAIDWVVEHRRDKGMNVRVINLAYGTTSTQGADVDPLARAVENAWKAGIVVVAAAGNDGVDSTSLLMPAVDPYVIAVGAVDHLGTRDLTDDVVADFSNVGNDTRRPDLLAPGKSVVSLRVANSYVDQLFPEGLIATDREHRYLRGSGTSQATSVVSGAVALLLQQRPKLTPDQVKAILRTSADPLAVADPAQGAGVLDVDGALDTATPTAAAVRQTWPMSTGLGSLDASRGGEYVIDPSTGDLLTGQVDALGDPFDSATWVAESTAGKAWDGGTWGTRPWTGDGWAEKSGADKSWAATTWTGSSWSGLPWTDHTWSEAYWEAVSWRDDSWLAVSWRGGTWEARSWRAVSWRGVSWRSDSWVAVSWRALV